MPISAISTSIQIKPIMMISYHPLTLKQNIVWRLDLSHIGMDAENV